MAANNSWTYIMFEVLSDLQTPVSTFVWVSFWLVKAKYTITSQLKIHTVIN